MIMVVVKIRHLPRLTFEFISDSMFEEGMSKAIERVLSIAQMYHLDSCQNKDLNSSLSSTC